jgi:hypothetical protein
LCSCSNVIILRRQTSQWMAFTCLHEPPYCEFTFENNTNRHQQRLTSCQERTARGSSTDRHVSGLFSCSSFKNDALHFDKAAEGTRHGQAWMICTERLCVKTKRDAHATQHTKPKFSRRTPGVLIANVRPAGLAAYAASCAFCFRQPICCTMFSASYITTPLTICCVWCASTTRDRRPWGF